MKEFFGRDYLLSNRTARNLFEKYARKMPIFDYHNHLSVQEICQRRRFDNIAQVWLENDHYKWRVMRVCGIEEDYITGNADDFDKFQKWAQTLEKIPGNALYHWVHLELKRYFDIDEPLGINTAKTIWDTCNARLGQHGYDSVGMLERVNVRYLCTTDEPADSLEWHIKIASDEKIGIKVLPSFRPDAVLHIDAPDWKAQITKLQTRFGITIDSFDALKHVLGLSVAHFKNAGCVVSDHGFIDFVYAAKGSPQQIFAKAVAEEKLTKEEIAQYKGALLRFLAELYCQNNMAMQLHLGALRSNNTLMFNRIGPNTGYDSVGSMTDPAAIGAFLDDITKAGCLPKTVLYGLNPADNPVLSTMAVNFACSDIPGKIQLGSAWWFLDNVRGINNQLDELLESGLISTFIGMLTDSRSFTSFSRHEFFRRILCSKLGQIIENGEYPADIPAMGRMVQDICYQNAMSFFGFER